jgi:hypothetical protein
MNLLRDIIFLTNKIISNVITKGISNKKGDENDAGIRISH